MVGMSGNGRKRLQEELSAALYAYIDNLKARMDGQFGKFDKLILDETDELTGLNKDLRDVKLGLDIIKKAVSRAL
jgi:hypothetical protein